MKKSVLITGSSRGLGNGLTAGYLRRGFRVFACARSKNSPGFIDLRKEFGDLLQVFEMDISDTSSVIHTAAEIKSMTDCLDILINNAGIHAEDSFKVLEEIHVDNCLEAFNVNTLGPLRVSKEFLPLLEKGNLKLLVNISSESGSIANCHREKEFDYCMSKAALNMQSVLLQNYLKCRNVKVLAVHPGWFRSDMGGPDAHLAIDEAAEYVIAAIEKYGDSLENPVFIDTSGNRLPY